MAQSAKRTVVECRCVNDGHATRVGQAFISQVTGEAFESLVHFYLLQYWVCFQRDTLTPLFGIKRNNDNG